MRSRSTAKKTVIAESQAKTAAYAWHAHDYREVLTVVGSTESGISEAEAQKRLAKNGRNEFSEKPSVPWYKKVFAQLVSPIAIVLVIAFAITASLQEFLDAGVIALALCIAVAVSLFQEGKASRAFEKLAASQVGRATVFRNGERHEIDAAELVVGDLVELQSGVQVPADLRLTKTKLLTINEASLTGEWLAEDKETITVPVGTHLAERTNMAWKGTYVASGYGTGVVVAVGDATEVGALAQGLQLIEDEETPIQYEMKRVSMFMLYVIGAVITLLFSVGLLYGQSLHDMALMAIAVAVASIPEGLPAAVTIILAVGMEALLKRGGLVRNLLAAETLGSTTYVLTDKTGTLTQAKMAVTGVIHGDVTNLNEATWHSDVVVREVFNVALCATDAFEDMVDGERVLRGDPVEQAILEAAGELGFTPDENSLRAIRADYLAFSSENRFAAGVSEVEGDSMLCINGAPEFLLAQASYIATADGKREITESDREQLLTAIRGESAQGKRLVAVAFKSVNSNDIPDDADLSLIQDCIFAGVLILNDPVRDGVGAAIEGVQAAGTTVLLITGDNAETALSIARKVGIAGPHESALTGSEIADLSDSELLAIFSHVHVFARVLPRQKMRIAEILQQAGETVAMTGDGINDAPALRKANIGIAIGSGTQVAQEASDLVLINDSFATIYAAIEEGRRIISNLRKVIGYLLSTSLSEVVLIGAALLTGGVAPILPVQILWANIIEEGLMSVAFAFEPGEKGAMKRKPQDIHEEGILSRHMIGFLSMVVVILSSLTVGLYFYFRNLGMSDELLRSAMFLSVAADSLFIAFAFRSLATPFWKIPLWDNRFFLGSFALSTLLLFGALSVPFMREVLSYTPLPASIVLTIIGVSVIGFAVVELAKFIFFILKK